MRMRKLHVLLHIVLILTLACPAIAQAESMHQGYATRSLQKFGRGMTNILTSPTEFTCAIYYDAQMHPFTAAVTGSSKGALLLVRRAVVGVFEVVSFMVPTEPLIDKTCNGETWHVSEPKKRRIQKKMMLQKKMM